MENVFDIILDSDEQVLKVFKPSKKKFWWANILTYLMSTIWIFAFVLFSMFFNFETNEFTTITLGKIFTALVIYAVVWLLNILLSKIYYKNLFYGYTNKRIIIRKGIFGVDYKSLDMGMIGAVNVYVSVLDKILGGKTGSITFGSTASPITSQGGAAIATYKYANIDMPYDVYKEVKKHISEFKKQENK